MHQPHRPIVAPGEHGAALGLQQRACKRPLRRERGDLLRRQREGADDRREALLQGTTLHRVIVVEGRPVEDGPQVALQRRPLHGIDDESLGMMRRELVERGDRLPVGVAGEVMRRSLEQQRVDRVAPVLVAVPGAPEQRAEQPVPRMIGIRVVDGPRGGFGHTMRVRGGRDCHGTAGGHRRCNDEPHGECSSHRSRCCACAGHGTIRTHA